MMICNGIKYGVMLGISLWFFQGGISYQFMMAFQTDVCLADAMQNDLLPNMGER